MRLWSRNCGYIQSLHQETLRIMESQLQNEISLLKKEKEELQQQVIRQNSEAAMNINLSNELQKLRKENSKLLELNNSLQKKNKKYKAKSNAKKEEINELNKEAASMKQALLNEITEFRKLKEQVLAKQAQLNESITGVNEKSSSQMLCVESFPSIERSRSANLEQKVEFPVEKAEKETSREKPTREKLAKELYKIQIHTPQADLLEIKSSLEIYNDLLRQNQEACCPKRAYRPSSFNQKCLGNHSHQSPVSYTHLTLPTILLVQISVVAVSLKKKNKIIETGNADRHSNY
eukprot:TRINITY_DN1339_c0_g1_i6.p1 TRINITY_DN1339_c0_g1~~TRINITY_DN1339_c0_g1_i6.p1  ORF type:complete len:291 (-),score=69.75 TRINITY_DN1339_c0_g1_i6:57-929(-)